MERLGEMNKQIDVHIDVLTLRFLEFMKNNDCKILHLTNNMFKTDEQEQETILVEENNFMQEELTAKQFKERLTPADGRLHISLVVLDKINCESFCKVLQELQVPHVVSFKLKDQLIKKKSALLPDQPATDQKKCIQEIVEKQVRFHEASLFCFYFS